MMVFRQDVHAQQTDHAGLEDFSWQDVMESLGDPDFGGLVCAEELRAAVSCRIQGFLFSEIPPQERQEVSAVVCG
jgi:hypothetical protein